MIALPNNCSCSELKVLPNNWSSAKASLKKDWMIYYRFYDPCYKADPKYRKGKLIRLKGMNSFATLSQRQAHTRNLMESGLCRLRDEAYNPITDRFAAAASVSSLNPAIPFLLALKEAEGRIKASKSTKRDLRSVLGFITKAAEQLSLAYLPIAAISRKHIKLILSQIEENQGSESPHRYNKNRTYLMILYKELMELEAVETNPVREISKKQRVLTLRTVLTLDERKRIDAHLKQHHYRFWLFTHIFFHSGARLTEIMQVRRKDVDLEAQTFVVTIRKGKLSRQVLKPIKNVSLPYWHESVHGAKPDDYIFSVGLTPGRKPINTDQITKRWKLHIKDKLGIAADFYSLKHLHLDEIASQLSLEEAAAMASHTSTAITLKHYTVNETQRRNERVKKLNNDFA